MNIENLIERAKTVSGIQFGQMAKDMHISQARISEWKKGKYRPGPSEIAYLAEKAHLSVLETVAEIEAQLRPEMADVWKRAVSQLRQNKG